MFLCISDMHQISAVENPAHRGKEDEDVLEQKAESQDRWFEDFDMLSDPPDAGEMVDDQSDISDYEDTIKKKKKKVSVYKNNMIIQGDYVRV